MWRFAGLGSWKFGVWSGTLDMTWKLTAPVQFWLPSAERPSKRAKADELDHKEIPNDDFLAHFSSFPSIQVRASTMIWNIIYDVKFDVT